MSDPLVPTNDTLRRREQADRLEAEEAVEEAEEWLRRVVADARAEAQARAGEGPSHFLFGRARPASCSPEAPYCAHRPACKR